MMAAEKKKRPRFLLFTIFHILHVCISIGLVIAVVRNQLVNESRFERLERSDCACRREETQRKDEVNKSFDFLSEQSSSQTNDKTDTTTARPLAKRTLVEYPNHSYQNEHSYNDTEIPEPGSMNKTFSNSTVLKEGEATARITVSAGFKFQNISDEGNKDEPWNSSTEYKKILGILGKEARQLFSCLDKLKFIIKNQVTTDRKIRDGCKLLQGDPGEKGAMGPKGCSGTSLANPTFKSNPRYLVFNEGDPAVLSCNATANPPPQITWHRDNVMLLGQRDNGTHRYVISDREVVTYADSSRAQICPSEIPHPVTSSTLVIKKSLGSDTGTYICRARNILGAYSYKIRILVQVYVQLTKTPANLTAVQGNNVQLSCRASGVPTPVITWYRKDGGLMPSQYNITEGDLHIHNISKEEEGTFVCLATNVLGSKTAEATITVNVFPKITSFINQPITKNESQALVLACNATGYPSPELRWSKVNDSLPEGRYVYDSQMLNISRVEYEDRGEYVCTANNTVGRTAKTATVIVQVGPKIIKLPNATEFGYRGKTKRLSLQIFSFPKSNITWKRPYWDRRSDARFRQENGDLIIENVQYTDSGRYQATARNILGEVKVTTFLLVRDAVSPFLTTKPSKEVMTFSTGQTISLTCTAVGVPSPKVTWRNTSSDILTSGVTGPDSSRTVTIDYFTSQKRGRYTCTAENDFGVAEAHVYLIINSDIRLADRSSNPYQGRVEVYRGGTWGTMCNHQWDMKHARIACQQLGFRNAVSAFTKTRVGQAPGTVYRYICRGSEKRLQECNTGPTSTSRYTGYQSYRRRYSRTSYICAQKVDAYVKCN